MAVSRVLIGGEWRSSLDQGGEFRAEDPLTGESLEERFPISGFRDLEQALEAGSAAAAAMRSLPPEAVADFLDGYAARLEERGGEIARLAARETGLPEKPRLREVELPRTVDQLHQAADAARDRSWRLAVIDTVRQLRSMYGPLDGPVAVFGPNNFPLAFNAVSGGDFAAALAAGHPVIAKAHPGHPGTTRLLAETAEAALRESALPAGAVQMIYHMRPQDGFRLVVHPRLGAVSFTGNRRSGLALKRAADAVGKPIYLELSGVNPVILLPGALKERKESIAEELASSCTAGAGQFCTNPGLIILPGGPEGDDFVRIFAGEMEERPAGCLVGRQVLESLGIAIARLIEHGAETVTGGEVAEEGECRFANTVLKIEGDEFLNSPAVLQNEAFGPSTLLVICRNQDGMRRVIESLEGNLTGSIYSGTDGGDDPLYTAIEPLVRARVGRLINDAAPTGVAVSPAMSHGGPFPATGHPGFTSVGIPRSLLRFAALQSYDRVRPHRLPPELRDPNPTGRMWRCIDGEWTTRHVPPEQG